MTVITVLLGWIVLSNHCALAGFSTMNPPAAKAPAKVEHRCCHDPGRPGDEQPASSKPEQCCKTLRVLVPDEAKTPDASGPLLAVIPFDWDLAACLGVHAVPAEDLDTGPPPDAPTFAELILKRSTQSHAPPAV